MRALVRRFDAVIRRVEGVFEFCHQEDCILRLQLDRARREIELPDTRIDLGAPVLFLHLWNERLPAFPPGGANLAWANLARHKFITSLHAVAAEIRHNPQLSDVQAIGGVTVLIDLPGTSGGAKFIERLGFSVFPVRSPLGRFGEFWENLYTWALMWTYNPGTLQGRNLFRLKRVEIWISRGDFLRRYAVDSTGGKNKIIDAAKPQSLREGRDGFR